MGEKWGKKLFWNSRKRIGGGSRYEMEDVIITMTMTIITTNQGSLPRSVNFGALLNQRRYYKIIPSGQCCVCVGGVRRDHMNHVEHAFHVMFTLCYSCATNMDPTSSLTEDLSHLSVSDENAPHEGAFPGTSPSPQLTRVSRERDVFIDDDHKIYDAEIMNTFSLYRKHDEEADLPSLLSITTLGDKRLVTLTPGEADELLAREPSIKMVLQKVWIEGSFREVRQLGMFGVQLLPIFST